MNITKLAKEHNLSYNTIYMRLKRGATMEEALKPQKRVVKNPKIIFEVEGTKECLKDLAQQNDLSYSTLYARFRRLKNRNIQDILFPARDINRPMVNYKGEQITVREVAKRENLSYNTTYVRWKRGWQW